MTVKSHLLIVVLCTIMKNPKFKIIFSGIILLFIMVLIKGIILCSNRLLFSQVKKQTQKINTILAQQGKIYDRKGTLLFQTQSLYQIGIYKKEVRKNDEIYLALKNTKSLKGNDLKKLDDFFNDTSRNWLEIATPVPQEEAYLLKDVRGLSLIPKYEKKYEYDWKILKNLDQYYDQELSSSQGYLWTNQDANGNTLYRPDDFYLPHTNGKNLTTSLDTTIQTLLSSELASAIAKYNSDGASGVIMDPNTGEIIAADYIDYLQTGNRIPFSQDLFETGSIFKPITLAIALETHSITKDHTCAICTKPVSIGKYTISNYDGQVYPNSSLIESIKNSDNIALSEIGLKIGASNFKNFFSMLNLTKTLNTDLPANAHPLYNENPGKIDLATNSFGQGIAISQLHILAAFSTLANGGQFFTPHLGLTANNDSHQVFSADTTTTIKYILKTSTQLGKASRFNTKSLDVCGKSGTAQIAVSGKYQDGITNASYIGFWPCASPKYAMIITIAKPRSSPWGATTAAPVWYKIAGDIM